MGGLSLEEKKEKIDFFFLRNYNELYQNSRTLDEFRHKLKKVEPVELQKMIEDDKSKFNFETFNYYQSKVSEFSDKFVEENDKRTKEEEEKTIQYEQALIDTIIKAKYSEAKKKENINDFKNFFKQNEKIKKLISERNENKDYYNTVIYNVYNYVLEYLPKKILFLWNNFINFQ